MTPGAADDAEKVPPTEVDGLYQDPTPGELERSEDSPKPPSAPITMAPDVPGSNLLNGLAAAAPFSEYLHYKALANCTHKAHQDCIRQYSSEHKPLSWCCMMLDLAFRILVVGAILAVVGAVVGGVIVKTFYS